MGVDAVPHFHVTDERVVTQNVGHRAERDKLTGDVHHVVGSARSAAGTKLSHCSQMLA